MDEDLSHGRDAIRTWDTLKKKLRNQFLPMNTAWVAREALKKLRHTGSVREYVKEFSSLMLEINNMSEEDRMFNFLSGLQPWAHAELRRLKVTDLPSAIEAADSLNDFKFGSSSSNPDRKKNREEGKRNQRYERDGRRDKKKDGDSSKGKGTDHSQSQRNSGCFLCNGPHRARDCPRREKLSALIAQEDSNNETEDVNTRLNPIQLLSAISSDKSSSYKGLMFMKILVNGKPISAMLDTGATNNFISQRIAENLGLTVSSTSSQIKAVNSSVQKIQGIATTSLKVGTWENECNFMVVTLDDFELILGVEFFIKAKAMPIPHLSGMTIHDEGSPRFLKARFSGQAGKPLLQSASQIKSGVKRGELTMLAALIEVKEDEVVEVSNCIAEVLENFNDVIP